METNDKIFFYEREFYPFSNFSSFSIKFLGFHWQTSEHAFQAMKFIEIEPIIFEQIKNASSAHDAKKIAKEHAERRREDWSAVKVSIMEEIVREKLLQHEYIQKKLLETGDKEIVEDSPKDSFWGWGFDQKGENHLGKIWMKLREEMKNK